VSCISEQENVTKILCNERFCVNSTQPSHTWKPKRSASAASPSSSLAASLPGGGGGRFGGGGLGGGGGVAGGRLGGECSSMSRRPSGRGTSGRSTMRTELLELLFSVCVLVFTDSGSCGLCVFVCACLFVRVCLCVFVCAHTARNELTNNPHEQLNNY
jgi:hypothetical protein